GAVRSATSKPLSTSAIGRWTLDVGRSAFASHSAVLPLRQKSALASSPYPGHLQTARHLRRGAYPLSSGADYEFADLESYSPAPVSLCSHLGGHGRFQERA